MVVGRWYQVSSKHKPPCLSDKDGRTSHAFPVAKGNTQQARQYKTIKIRSLHILK